MFYMKAWCFTMFTYMLLILVEGKWNSNLNIEIKIIEERKKVSKVYDKSWKRNRSNILSRNLTDTRTISSGL